MLLIHWFTPSLQRDLITAHRFTLVSHLVAVSPSVSTFPRCAGKGFILVPFARSTVENHPKVFLYKSFSPGLSTDRSRHGPIKPQKDRDIRLKSNPTPTCGELAMYSCATIEKEYASKYLR